MICKQARVAGNAVILKYIAFVMVCLVCISCASSPRDGLQNRASDVGGSQIPEEYDRAGRLIVNALRSGDADAFMTLIDRGILLHRAFQGMTQTNGIANAMMKLHAKLDRAGLVMVENLGNRSVLTYVRTRLVNAEHRALVRVDMEDRGLTYVDFVLQKDSDGVLKITDWYDFAQGQFYCESLRQGMLLMFPGNDSLFATLFGDVPAGRDSAKRFSMLASLAYEKRYDQWLIHYHNLPDRLKHSRIALVTRVLVASAAGNENEYLSALKDVSGYIGDDPSLSLLLLDYYLSERDYVAANRSLDRLIEYTGGDAALSVLKAKVSLTAKNYLDSLKFARKAIEEDAGLEDAYWTLFGVSVYLKEYNTAVAALRHLERQFGYVFDPDEIGQIRGYEKFASSRIFSDWKYGILP